MAYTKQTWVRGEKVASAKLNHMEDGIDAISANGAIGTANLANASVTNNKLDQEAVDSDNIRTGAIITPLIYDGAVTLPKLGADVIAELDNKADIDGSYEGMTVGNAEQLVSSVGVEDNAPYTFRTTGGSADVGDRMNLKKVVGGTVAWNQLQSFGAGTEESAGVTYTRNSDGSITCSGISTGDSYLNLGSTLTGLLNHVLYICGCPKGGSTSTYYFRDGYNGNGSDRDIGNGKIIKGRSNYVGQIVFRSGVDSTGLVFRPQMFDLTVMFGSTIADYVYTLESGTAGAGIAWLKKYGYFTKPYYPYKAAALESVKTSAHKTYGFNAYNPSTGKAKVVGGMVYQITGAYTALSLDGTSITPDASGYFTPSANGELTVTSGNGTTTCIHLKWDGERDGEYEPYEEHTYALDDVELRGILKLDASNNLYYDGDRYLPDGTVERRFAERAYQSGDESLADAITDGTTTVYKLATPTTETADHYTQTQIVDDFGTEEFVDAAVEANERDVAIPVGNETVYKQNLRAKLEMAPDSPDGDGDYIVRQTNGQNEYVLFSEVKELPDFPSNDGSYKLRCTVTNGAATLSWVSDS